MPAFPLGIVTGGAHRLGRAFALTLAYQGFGVLVHYHRASKAAEQTVEDIRSFRVPAYFFEADLLDPRQIEAMFNYVDSLLAAPDSQISQLAVLVNSAARLTREGVMELSFEDWDTTMNLNLRAPYFCAQNAAKRMKHGGLIVNVSDIGAQKSWSRFPSYSISKAGLEGLTRVLARSLAPTIRVNAIAPGLILPDESMPPTQWKTLAEKMPLKRHGTVEEVSTALELLLKNAYITGQTIVVDGGYSLI